MPTGPLHVLKGTHTGSSQKSWLTPESQEGFGLVVLMSDGVGSGELSLGLGSLQWEGREEKRPQPLMEEERLGLEQA